MKKIVFWLIYALAIVLPASFQGNDQHTTIHNKASLQANTIHNFQAATDNIQDCDFLEYRSDDDLTESERKKTQAAKSQFNDTKLVAANFPGKFNRNACSTGPLLSRRASLYIYFSVFRI